MNPYGDSISELDEKYDLIVKAIETLLDKMDRALEIWNYSYLKKYIEQNRPNLIKDLDGCIRWLNRECNDMKSPWCSNNDCNEINSAAEMIISCLFNIIYEFNFGLNMGVSYDELDDYNVVDDIYRKGDVLILNDEYFDKTYCFETDGKLVTTEDDYISVNRIYDSNENDLYPIDNLLSSLIILRNTTSEGVNLWWERENLYSLERDWDYEEHVVEYPPTFEHYEGPDNLDTYDSDDFDSSDYEDLYYMNEPAEKDE